MALPAPPTSVLQYLNEAASGTGLPLSVVEAQNYTESSYGSNMGPSVTGAEGPWQFEPGTWPGYSSLPFSDATNWADSTAAYVKLMSSLLKQYNGNIRNALAAYNAGSGNLSAGYGYADSILALANQPQSATSGSGTTTTDSSVTSIGGGGILGDFQSLLGLGQATAFATDLEKLISGLMWIVTPGAWLRIGAFIIAIILLIGAVIIFTHTDEKIMNTPIPIPVPV